MKRANQEEPDVSRFLLAAVVLVALSGPRSASAQNALGDGTGLQRDATNYGQNPRPPARYDIMDSIRFRNAVVTGNVPMGKHFRGDGEELPSDFGQAINQPSPFEFRGAQSGDATFAFRRDSLFSGMAGTGIRGTEALQYQLAITTASAPPPGFAIDMLPQRDGNLPSAGATLNNRLPLDKPLTPSTALRPAQPGDAGYDPRGRGLQDLRSTSSFRANQTLQPELLSRQQLLTGDIVGITSSELRGLRMKKFEEEEERPVSPYAAPSLEASNAALEAEPIDTRAVDLSVTPVSSSYDEIMAVMSERMPEVEQPAEAEAQPMSSLEALELRLAEIRAQLAGELPPAEPEQVPETDEPTNANAEPDENDDGVKTSKYRFDPETIAMIRETGDDVESLAPVGHSRGRDLFGEHMSNGQKLIESRRYFDAEARFTAALSVRPGDPMASIGRVHAQLGAGMFESAAINLRQLLVAHPEVTGVRYSPDLMPPLERLEQLVSMLRKRRDTTQKDDPGVGLLIAYIGYQSEDAVTLRQGLDIVLRADQDRVDEGLAPDPVSSLIIEVWSPGE